MFEYKLNPRHPRNAQVAGPLVFVHTDWEEPINLKGQAVKITRPQGNGGPDVEVEIRGATQADLAKIFDIEEKAGKAKHLRQVIRVEKPGAGKNQ